MGSVEVRAMAQHVAGKRNFTRGEHDSILCLTSGNFMLPVRLDEACRAGINVERSVRGSALGAVNLGSFR
jgi:hypothetical protein